ncbi:hypothetical protein RUM43_014251 [Polyplax serrata]|uniref:Major facilitator superfamily (MFS) profile domain-containing protein n=1 Tax=Polyplax serrata TaxID=468196 RepID=A0AAN8P1A6_POLSC
MSLNTLASSTTSSCFLVNFLSARATLGVMAFLMFLITQMIRINVYIALLDMGQKAPVNGTDDEVTILPEWNENKFSLFMGAFYWSYWATELPGGILAQKFGGKRIMGICITAASLLNFLLPFACHNSFLLASIIRALQGLSLGVTWPVMHWLSARWIPQSERSKFMTSYHGAAIGTSITYPLAGLIIANYGWESVFYVIGTVSLVWCLAWWILIYDSPKEHPRLSESERKYLEEALGNSVTLSTVRNKRSGHPWREIMQSKPFWAVLMASQGLMWGTLTLSMQTPTYFHQVHGLDIKSTGLLSGIPEISKFFFALLFSAMIDRVIDRKILTVTQARKVAVAVSSVFHPPGELIPAVLLLLLGVFGYTDKILATVLLSGTCLVGGASASGSLANIIDISPNHAGTLLGLIKTLTIIPGVISPLMVTNLTSDPKAKKSIQWRNVFGLIAIIYSACGTIYLIFGSGKVQPWNEKPEKDKSKEETGFLEDRKLDERRISEVPLNTQLVAQKEEK